MKFNLVQFFETHPAIGHTLNSFMDLRTVNAVYEYPDTLAVEFYGENVHPMIGDFEKLLKIGLINIRVEQGPTTILYFKKKEEKKS